MTPDTATLPQMESSNVAPAPSLDGAALGGSPCSAYRLAINDAARIPQPTYADLWDAYIAGAKSGQKHPAATECEINRSADAWCKLLHARRDPEGFEALGK